FDEESELEVNAVVELEMDDATDADPLLPYPVPFLARITGRVSLSLLLVFVAVFVVAIVAAVSAASCVCVCKGRARCRDAGTVRVEFPPDGRDIDPNLVPDFEPAGNSFPLVKTHSIYNFLIV